MSLILIACLLVETAGFLIYIYKRDQGDRAERESWQAERTVLLNRIQAPEVAAIQTSDEPSSEPLYVPAEDDEAWAEYVEDRAAGKVN